jgi:RNA polymerase sigma factor (sigma-70 family)
MRQPPQTATKPLDAPDVSSRLARPVNSAKMPPVCPQRPGASTLQLASAIAHNGSPQGCLMARQDDPQDLSADTPPLDAEPQYLPVENPAFLKKFIHQYFDTLTREASRACYQYNIPDYADDALSISFEKFMTSRIEDRGPRSAISFAVRILKNTCIDEARRRGRHAIPAGALISNDDEDGGGDFIEERVAEQTSSNDPEAQLIASAEMNAVDLGFDMLPILTRKTHKNVERDLDIVRKRYVLRMSWSEIAQDMGAGKAHRQSAARGRELLRGWVHALCGTQPEPDAANRKYWQRGYESGCAYREQFAGATSR